MASISFNSTFSFGSTIGEVIKLDLSGIKVSAHKTSHLLSTGNAETYISGRVDYGELKLEINYAKAQFNALMNLLRTTQAFALSISDASTFTGSGILTDLGLAIPEDDRITCPITIKITGVAIFTSS